MMWRPDPAAVAARLAGKIGLPLEANALPRTTDWPALEIRPSGIRREIAFAVRLELGWRSISCSLQPGAFAAPLVGAMGEAGESERAGFIELARKCVEARANVHLSINGAQADPLRPDMWPKGWQRVELSLVKSPAVVNTEDAAANDTELEVWTRRFLSLALALMPVEELEEDGVQNPEGLPEGACVRVEMNRYERSRINRAACIDIHGDSCLACDFDFGAIYGEVGLGFIHVHHVVPVSRIGSDYRVNPVTDLVPLCPNCHAMAHRFDPPASVEMLRAILKSSGM